MTKMNTVLIVEDDKIQAMMLKLLLTKLDYNVLATSETGERAVLLALEHKPHLIMMDISLAGEIDGIEAVRRIILQTPSVNIIYLTGNSDPAHKKRAEDIGFIDFLLKPINKKILVDSLSKLNYQMVIGQHENTFVNTNNHEYRN